MEIRRYVTRLSEVQGGDVADDCERVGRVRCYEVIEVILVVDIEERGCGEFCFVIVDFGDMWNLRLDYNCRWNYVTTTTRTLSGGMVFE